MNIVVTGSAGFIGYHVSKYLLAKLSPKKKIKIIGIDNLNNYYDIKLKEKRIKDLRKNKNFYFHKINISNFNKLDKIFKSNKIDYVINLAAQAGVRYSIQNPTTYFNSNLKGFFNILEIARLYKIKHLITASTSSVYGNKRKFPIGEEDDTNKPLSFYAATKKSNEVMAFSYSNIYSIPITCLRFFTVYGPYGRPDMFLYKYVDAAFKNKNIYLFNKGNHVRDFTYVDDVTKSIFKLLKKPPTNKDNYQVLNIGNGNPVLLKDFIKTIDSKINKLPKITYANLQNGDVYKTHAKVDKLKKIINYKPKTSHKNGIKNFIDWYKKNK